MCSVVILTILFTAVYAAPTFDSNYLEYVYNYYEDTDDTYYGEFGNFFEGDILLNSRQKKIILDTSEFRNGQRDVAKRWPERTVVYEIATEDFDDTQLQMIEDGLADIANHTCIKFRKREGDEHAVFIEGSNNGCYSNVGFSNNDDENERVQTLNLAKGCFNHGTIVHELLHTVGFFHMQSASNRDDFVKINWKNIRPGTEGNFAKYDNDTVTDFGVEYDYSSVMHYPANAFSTNGDNTIVPLQEGVKIGQRKGLSKSDILKINKMYCELKMN